MYFDLKITYLILVVFESHCGHHSERSTMYLQKTHLPIVCLNILCIYSLKTKIYRYRHSILASLDIIEEEVLIKWKEKNSCQCKKKFFLQQI